MLNLSESDNAASVVHSILFIFFGGALLHREVHLQSGLLSVKRPERCFTAPFFRRLA